MPTSPRPSTLATAVASLLGMPAVRHLLSVIATLLAGWLLLRFGGLLPPAPAPVATAIEALSAPVEPPVDAGMPASVEVAPGAAEPTPAPPSGD